MMYRKNASIMQSYNKNWQVLQSLQKLDFTIGFDIFKNIDILYDFQKHNHKDLVQKCFFLFKEKPRTSLLW